MALGLALVVAVLAAIAVYLSRGDDDPAPREPEPSGKASAGSLRPPRKPAEYGKLLGRWVRPDGGYVLEIKGTRPDGQLDAAYLNPRPINVSQARASVEDGRTTVFIELRDRGYPGSYYTLIYDARADRLVGVYHQLVIGQKFDVVFVRLRPQPAKGR